ncbi:histidinol dehydrogenase [Candidatus Gracilibacteria bacterium]|nr:histidinol dehydrogenase [Candidatus Gracilibacteria bacterium]
MKTYFYSELSAASLSNLCLRKSINFEKILLLTREMQKSIQNRGDDALKEYTKRFDKVEIDSFLVSAAEFEVAQMRVSDDFKQSIAIAAQNIRTFHESQISSEKKIETSSGVICWRENRAIQTVGLYVPGGTAPLFSTLLMSAIPAQAAGCSNIIICTPPQKDGTVTPEILWTANFLGLKSVYKIGGAQAIFALAEGTEEIPKVDKIFGPGNQYVTAAKMVASEKTVIDMPAGPSEVLVIATEETNVSFAAADLLSQAEHGVDSEVVLVTNSQKIAENILVEVSKQIQKLPRKNIVQEVLANSFVLITKTLEEAFDFSNLYAPEHLILGFSDYAKWVRKIQNAGSVFCGPLSCESFGDYASGTNHILPTSGFARSFSGVSTESFLKKITFQEITKKGCKNLGPIVEKLAEKEMLQAHKNAVSLRLNSDK